MEGAQNRSCRQKSETKSFNDEIPRWINNFVLKACSLNANRNQLWDEYFAKNASIVLNQTKRHKIDGLRRIKETQRKNTSPQTIIQILVVEGARIAVKGEMHFQLRLGVRKEIDFGFFINLNSDRKINSMIAFTRNCYSSERTRLARLNPTTSIWQTRRAQEWLQVFSQDSVKKRGVVSLNGNLIRPIAEQQRCDLKRPQRIEEQVSVVSTARRASLFRVKTSHRHGTAICFDFEYLDDKSGTSCRSITMQNPDGTWPI